eukprot:c53111_g1_i1.p1 GENE.c53111_g1_i1~~c53111_g1_i1.p1  ORF type:complete len:561 (-),score=100.20 c53111_g1_i1:97-1779(-)
MLAANLRAILLLTQAVNCLRIITHNNVNISIPSPIFNSHLGQQSLQGRHPITAAGVFLGHRSACQLPYSELSELSEGRVVFFVRTTRDFWDLTTERDNLNCLQATGAVGMVIAYPLFHEPGLGANLWVPGTNNPSAWSIPLLHVVTSDFPEDLLQTILNSNFTVELGWDPNPYEELWDSKLFFVMWRLVFPVINGAGMMVGFSGLFLMIVSILTAHERERWLRWVRNVMKISMFLVLTTASTFRFVYAIVGPFYTNVLELPRMSIEFHRFMLNMPILLEIIGSLFAIVICRQRWARFTFSPRVLQVDKALAALAGLSLVGCLIIAILHMTRFVDITFLSNVLVPALFLVLVSVVCVVSTQRFIAYVSPRATQANVDNVNRGMRGSVMLVSWALNATVLIVLAAAIMWRDTLVYSVQGYFMAYTVIFTAIGVQSITLTTAFFPPAGIILNDLLCVKQGQSFRSPIFGRKGGSAKHIVNALGDTVLELRPQSRGPASAQPCLVLSNSYEDVDVIEEEPTANKIIRTASAGALKRQKSMPRRQASGCVKVPEHDLATIGELVL